MIRRTVLSTFVGLAGVVTAQVVTAQTVGPKTEKAQLFNLRGRVVDESGDPVQGVSIRVEAGPDGLPIIRRFPPTDEHGDFGLSLANGKYYIMANPVVGLLDNQQEIHTDGSSGDPYGATYYPSTVNKSAAVPVSVTAASGDTEALVIRLLRQSKGPVAVSTPAGQKTASVEGVVVNQLTGAPLPHVHVSLWNYDDGVHRVYGAMTHPDGTFSITGMPPLGYGIVINRAGFANARPGRTSVTLLAGEATRDLKLPMVPSGAIAGRVSGPDGEPAEDINVYVRGRRGQFGSKTDEQGRFRITGLLPGSYRLEAPPLTWASPSKPPRLPSDGPPPTHWGAAHYQGVIEVQAGSETRGIEVRLTRTPVVRVSGRVTGFTQGTHISLSVNGRFGGFTDIAKADGTFAWWSLDPGEYVIRAWQGPPSLDYWASRGERPGNSALTTITVADANVDHLELRFRPPSDLSGQVEYETGEAEPHSPEKWLRLSALNLNNGGGAAMVSADGHFTLNPLLPGRYKVTCDCLRPADCKLPAYVKSMWLGSARIEGDILDLSDGPAAATLRVLVSSTFGSISGTVQGERAAMADLKVALVSPRPDRPPRFADIDVGGRYSFDSVAPGEYQLAVVDDDDLLLQGADRLEQHRQDIVPVKVLAGESIIRNPSIFKRH